MDQRSQGESSSGALSLSGAGGLRESASAVWMLRPWSDQMAKSVVSQAAKEADQGAPAPRQFLRLVTHWRRARQLELLSSGIAGRSRKRVNPSQWATRLFTALRQCGGREEERASISASRFMSARRSTRAVRFLIQSSDSFPRRWRVQMRQIQGGTQGFVLRLGDICLDEVSPEMLPAEAERESGDTRAGIFGGKSRSR